MLQKAEDNLRTQKVNEQKQLEEILDLKKKIANQSNEIHYLREFYRSNHISPTKSNPSNINQPKTDNILQKQTSSPKTIQQQNSQPQPERINQTAENGQNEVNQLSHQNHINNLANQDITNPSPRPTSVEQPITVEETPPILPPPVQFKDPPNLPHSNNQGEAHKNYRRENEEWIRVEKRKNKYQNKENFYHQPYSNYSYKINQQYPPKYQDEPKPKYMYQITTMLPPKNDLYNMYKSDPSKKYHPSQEYLRYEPALPKADVDQHKFDSPAKDDLFNMYKPDLYHQNNPPQESASYKTSYLEVATNQHS